MKKYFGSLVFLISFFSFGQNYVENGQSYEYNFGNIAINHVYEEGSIISPDLNKVTFSELSGTPPNLVLNDTYGYGTGQDVPSDWSIIESSVIASSGASYDYASNQLTYDGNCNEEITLKVDIDTDGDGSADISNVRIRYQIICDFTLVQSYLNSCTNTYVIQMNEVALPSSSNLTGDARYPCRDYELFLYTANDYQIDGSGVLYGGSSITSNNGQFDLSDLPIGNYVYYVDNQCNQTFPDPNNPNIFPATFSIAEGYNFGSNVVFTGFECYEDEESIVDITLTSVAYPLDSWSLTDSNGDIVYSNEITDLDNDGSINFATDGQFSTGFSIETISILITGLEPGSYTLNFIDNLGCDETNTFKVLKPNNPLTAVETIFNVTCPSGQDGAVQFDLSGGWSEPFTENPFYPDNGDNPIWGDYQNYSLINVDTSQTYGSEFLYFAQDYYTILYTDLPAGNYVFTYDEIVANNALDEDIIYSCSNTVEFEITQPDEFVIQSELSNDAQCNDEPSGSIDILCVTGGTAQDPDNDNCFDYSYSWVASNGGIVPVGQENLQDLTGLMAGTYNVTITDDQGCTYSESFNIDEPDPLTIVYDTKQEVNCFGGADGSISVTVNGGTPFVDPNDSSVIDYDFTITKDGQNFTSFIETYNGSNSFILSGLPAGTYTIVVTDQNNCDADQVIEVVIEEPQEITYTIDQTTLLDCFGDSDGEITITVSGGTPGYSLSLTGTSTAFSTITSDGDSYTFTGLTVGSYAITIQDANFVSSPSGCDVTTGSLIINEPEELIISNLSATEILCNADETSTITGTITGGTTNYEVVLIGPGVNEVSSDNTGSINFTDLGSGIYIVQVSDTNIATGGSGCYVEQSITIDEPDQLAISQNGSEVDVTCFGENTGSFQVSVSGGTPNYIFTATDSDSNSIGNPVEVSTNVFEWSALYAGTYTIVVTDQNNCDADQVIEVVIEEPQEITYTIDQTTLLDCFGDSDGEITITVSGGTPGYSLSLTGTSTAFSTITSDGDSYTFTGLTVGSYAITIQDANFVSSPSGCDVTTGSLIINEPEELIISNLSATEILCNADETSTITGTITGGTTNYEVVLIGPGVNEVSSDNTGSINFTDLGSGIYIVQVSDTNIATGGSGCYVEQSITIDEPDQLAISQNGSEVDVTCFGENTGSFQVSVSGGTPNYIFTATDSDSNSIGNPVEVSTNVFEWSALYAGTYTIVVTDQNNCDADQVIEVVIEEPQEITYTIDQTTLLDCFGDSDGEITITVSGGTPGYSLSLTGTSTAFSTITSDGDSYTFTGLTVGSYAITIQDANFVSSPSGCDVTTGSLIINEPEELIISNLSATEILCNADETSTITGTITGGTTNYEVVLIGPGVNEVSSDNTGSINFTDLGSGIYIVQVSDTNIATGGSGCYVEQSITIDEPDQLLISGVTSAYPDSETGFGVTAFGATDGTIDITVEGGTLPYSFQWTVISGGPISGSTTSEDLFNLPAGVYSVIATDDNGCSIEMQFEITEPEPFLIFEDLTLHVDVDCYGASTGELGVYVTGGTAPYDFEIANTTGDTPVVIDAVTNIDGNEYSITGLEAGEYTLSSEDANNVLISTQVIILQPDAPIDITKTISDYNGYQISCFGAENGTISVVASGGGGPDNITSYTYSWKRDVNDYAPESPSTSDNLVGLSPGTYEVTVTDDVGCTYTETYVINQPDPLAVSATLSNYFGFNISINGEDDGSIDLDVSGGVESYTYSWTTSNGVIPTGQESNQDLSNLVAGTYNVTITDQNNCTISESFTLIEPNELTIEENLASHTDVNCFGASTGTLGVNISGGIPPYTYVLDNSEPIEIDRLVGQTNLFYSYTSGLSTGAYTVSVIDVSGAMNQIEITILQPDATIDITETISDFNGFSISCFGASDGTIDIVTTGGGGPSNSDQYTYEWTLGVNSFTVSSPSTDTNLQDLGPGVYKVTVTDNVGCTYTETYEITEPTGLTLSGVVSNNNQYTGFGVSAFGANDGFIDITVGGGTSSYTYAWSTSDGVVPSGQETNQNLTGLVAGTYTVEITDSNGCIITENYIVTEPELFIILEVESSHLDVLCYDDSTGELEVVLTGGATPYTYALTGPVTETQGPTPNTTYTKTGLPTGDYTVTATDANGTIVDVEITILQPDATIDITETISDFNGFSISCFGASDGTIDIVTTGGGGPSNSDQYTYEWTLGVNSFTVSSPSTDTNLQDLGPGVYKVTVTDNVGCTYTETYEITEPTGLTLSGVVSNNNQYTGFGVSASGANDGFIDITVGGGTSSYTYAWSTSDGVVPSGQETNQNLTGLVAGTYTVEITDSNGCIITENYIVTEPGLFTILEVESSHLDVLCYDDSTGELEVVLTGGATPYTYALTGPVTETQGPTPNTTYTKTGLPTGDYTVTATDANGTIVDVEITILQPDATIDITETISDFNGFSISCFGASDGTIDIVTTGGGGPSNSDQYTYEWTLGVNSFTVSSPSTDTNLQDLGPGVYKVTVTDNVGCTYTETYEITEPTGLTLSGVVSNNNQYTGFGVSASGANDGFIDITVGGGTSSYTYAWSTSDGVVPSGQETNQNLTGLVAGTYTVEITDSNGCIITENYIVTEPGLFTILEVESSHLDVLCYDDSTGELEVVLTGGATPYTYALTGPVTETQGPTPNTTYTKTGLPTGDYTVTATDANGTIVDVEITILQPDATIDITETISDFNGFSISCFGASDGTIDIVTTGGGGPSNSDQYTYEWTLGVNSFTVSSPSTDTNLQDLGPGVYKVTVTDNVGCTYTETYEITEPTGLTLSGVVSNNNQYTGFGVSAFGANDGFIDITVGGGTSSYTYAWSTSDGVVPSGQETNQNLTGLVAGTYTVEITDSNGCIITENYIVTEPGLFTILEVESSHLDVLCYDDSTGELEVVLTGGATPYTYALTGPVTETQGPTPNTTYTKTGLPTGDYTVTATDANGTIVDVEITILQPDATIDITLTPSIYGEFNISCFGAGDGSIDAVVTGGGGPENDAVYTYDWKKENIDLSLNTASTDTSLQELGPGNYELTVTDEEGCTAIATITITQPPALTLSGVVSNNNQYTGFGVSASGANDGFIDITVGGGTSSYTYAWSTSDGVVPSGQETNQNLTGLVAGTYTVEITDSNGCIITENYIVTEPGLFTILEVESSHLDVLCYDDSTGELEVVLTGGATPYTYALTGPVTETQGPTPNTTYTKTGLPTGDYTVTATDANGTIVDVEITILQPDATIDITETISDFNGFSISCFGASDGTIDIVTTGGGGPSNSDQYTYEWTLGVNSFTVSSPSTDTNLQDLGPGVYKVTVTDNVGCTYTETYEITEPTGLTLSGVVSNNNQYTGFGVSAFGANDGFIDITVGGGTSSYTYAWSTSDGVVPSGQETNQNLTGLVAGTYTVEITDSNGCIITENYIVTEPGLFTILEVESSHLDVLCYDDSTGELEVVLTGGATPYTYALTGPVTETQGPTPNTTYTKTGLPTGDYTVTATDANGTIVDVEITILQPDATIDITETISDFNGFSISCFGASDGTIDIVTTGGGGPSNSDQYTYEWTLGVNSFTVSSPSTDTNLQDLGPGVYKVTVTDNVGCTYTETYEITEPTGLTLSGVVSNNNQYTGFGVSASGANDGFIDITVGGGTSSYTYAWSTSDGVVPSGQETNQNLTGLVAGTYTVEITDSNGCIITENYIVTEPELFIILEVESSHLDVLCYDDSTGELEVVLTGGATPYTYALTGPVTETQGPTPNTTYTKTGLPTGDYTVTATDANGTIVDVEITILQPDATIDITETISDFNGFSISCFGASDGTIDIVTTGGGGPSNSDQYTYEWTLGVNSFTVSSPSTDTNLQDLGPGVYKVTVTDNVGCTYTETYEITEPTGLTLSGVVSNNNQYTGFGVSAFGANDGFIDITVGGGTSSYTYAWSTSDGVVPSGQETNQNLTGLVAGTYTVEITDSNGCIITENYIVTEPELFIILEVESSHLDVLCYDDSTGELEVVLTGGATPYTYALTGPVTETQGPTPNTTYTKTGLPTGDYTVTATDANGTIVDVEITILQPDATIDITETISDFNGFSISCFGASDGTIDIVTTGGGGPSNSDQYTYEWTLGVNSFTVSSPSTDTNLQDLGPGVYKVTVTDNVGCTYTETYEITEPTGLTLSGVVSDYNGFGVSCFGQNDGFITTTISGGTNNFDFTWTASNGGVMSAGQETNQNLTDLIAGTYTVTVVDTNSCPITESFVITEPDEFIIVEITTSHVDVLCYGENSGEFEVSIVETVGPYDYILIGTDYLGNPVNQSFTTTDLNVLYDELLAGDYDVFVSDLNGCSAELLDIIILQPNAGIDITETISDYNGFNISCFGANDGSIVIVSSGGGGPANSNVYTYNWTLNNTPYILNVTSTETSLQDLGPGFYEVTVTDAVGCTYTETYEITEPDDIVIIVDSEVDILCNGDLTGSISITPQGGSGDYTYYWTYDPDGNGGQQFDNVEDLENLGPGEYVILVEDSNGCFESEVFQITQPEPIIITVDSKIDILCHGDFTGSIDVSIAGGVPNYNISWIGPTGFVSGDEDISALEAGTYTLTIIDQNNCLQSIEVELTQPDDLIVNYTVTNETCTNANDGTITLDIQGGVLDYDIAWSNFGNGTTQTNLAPSFYTVTVTDDNNCVEELTIEIVAAPLFDIQPVVNSISCFGENDGNIQLNIQGGTAPLNVLWDDDLTAGQDRFNLGPGIYSVTISDNSSFNCVIEREFIIVEPAELTTSGVVTNALDCDIVNSGSIDLQVLGGTAPYTFEWSNLTDTEDLINIPPGNYAVTITDFNGCKAIDEFVVTRPDEISSELTISFDADCDNHIAFQTTTIQVSGGVPPYDITWSNGVISGTNGETMTTSQEGTVIIDVVDALGCEFQTTFEVDLAELGYPDFSYDSFTNNTCNIFSVDDLIQFTNLASGDYISVDWSFGDGFISSEENPTHIYTIPGTYYITQTVNYPYGCSYEFIKEIIITKGYEIILPNAFTPNVDTINDTIRPVFNCMEFVQMSIYDTFGSLIYSESSDGDIYGWDGTIEGKPAENGNYILVVKAESWNGKVIDINGPITLIK